MYAHSCPADGGRERITSWRRCRQCRGSARFHGWQWGVVESWARYHKRTGLSPFDPKPPEFEERQITRQCGRCNGVGILKPRHPGDLWAHGRPPTLLQAVGSLLRRLASGEPASGRESGPTICPECEGAGGFPVLEAWELARAREYAAEQRRNRRGADERQVDA